MRKNTSDAPQQPHSGAAHHNKKFPHPLPASLTPIVGMRHGEFLKHLPLFSRKDTILRKIFSYFFQLFEKNFDAHLYVQVPDSLRNINPELWRLGRLVSTLRDEEILSHIEPLPSRHDEPPLFRFQGVLFGMNELFHSSFGIGHSFFSESEAVIPAIGESVERYCYKHFFPALSEVKYASYKEMKERKKRAVDPATIVRISEGIRKKSNNPMLWTFSTEEAKLTWVRGMSLTCNKETWLPFRLVSASPSMSGSREEPFIRQSVSTGAAVGRAKYDALYRGICEVVERDAFMVTYLNRLSPSQIRIEELPGERMRYIKRQMEKYGLNLFLLYLPTDFPVHVIMAYLSPKESREEGPYFSLGFKTDLALEPACYGAVKEALNGWIAYHFMLERAEGLYIPSSSETEKIGQYERVYMWQTDPDALSKISFLGKGDEVSVSDLPAFSAAEGTFREKLKFLVSDLRKKEIEALYIENSTKNLLRANKKSGFPMRSFFVFIPSLHPMHLRESMACFEGERLKTVPANLGFPPASTINTFPHPIP